MFFFIFFHIRGAALAYIRQWRGKILGDCKLQAQGKPDLLPENFHKLIVDTRELRAEHWKKRKGRGNAKETGPQPWDDLVSQWQRDNPQAGFVIDGEEQ